MGFRANSRTALGIFLSLAAMEAQPAETGLSVEVDVYNYSPVSGSMLARAEQETARIFQYTGVAMTWKDCSAASKAAAQDAPTTLTLRLLTNFMADALRIGSDTFGSARLPEGEGFGVVADIYAERIPELARGRDFEMILGRAIAHELGHLLLGKNAHSPAGIMHTPWRARDLETTRQAAMSFTTTEAKKLRTQVQVRMAAAGVR